jgi:hypothetical protein
MFALEHYLFGKIGSVYLDRFVPVTDIIDGNEIELNVWADIGLFSGAESVFYLYTLPYSPFKFLEDSRDNNFQTEGNLCEIPLTAPNT